MIDLSLMLDMSAVKNSAAACIIIVEIDIDSKLFRMGIVADSAPWLIDLDPGAFEPYSSHGTKVNPKFILGIGKQNDRSFIILDIDSVLSDGELASIQFLAKITASVAEKTNTGNRGDVTETEFLENFRTCGELIH